MWEPKPIAISGTDDTMETEEKPKLILKPRVIVTFLPLLILILIFFWLPYFFVDVLPSIMGWYAFNPPLFYNPLLSHLTYFVLFFLLPLIGLIAFYKDVKSKEYRFFRNILEFYKGFWTKHKVMVRYEKITDVFMKKSAWQRMWGTGTIFVRTAKTGLEGRIQMRYIPQPEEAYRKVQEMMRTAASAPRY